MIFCKKTILLLILSSLLSIGWSQCEEGYTEYDGECYYDDDLSVLDINSGSKGPVEVTYRAEDVDCSRMDCPERIGENEPDRKYIIIDPNTDPALRAEWYVCDGKDYYFYYYA